MKKHLSAIANDVINQCAQKLETTVEALVDDFHGIWKDENGTYSKKLVEFCSSKALTVECKFIGERISDGSFSRFSFDVMLAWQTPTAQDEQARDEREGKETEDKRLPAKVTSINEDIPLFYTDILPLLVNNEATVEEDAFVWFGSSVPLAGDIVNGRFTFESLTASTANRLFYPAYDKFLKEINQRIKHLQKQAKPNGVELADDEFILHVDGTASTQRVVRHIGGTSWPGKLTLTNYALYFEASGVISYEKAIKVDLSKDSNHTVKPVASGPWGVPLFDKAIVYESPDLAEDILLEFPEVTSSTRRDHWLSLIKEIMLMHQFLNKYQVEDPLHRWEMHSKTILGIVRLHAAREMLRISPPPPTRFLIFSLFDEVPKGDFVLKELADILKRVSFGHPCSASSLLRSLNTIQPSFPLLELKDQTVESYSGCGLESTDSPLREAINQARKEAKEMDVAKFTSKKLKEEGIGETLTILLELLDPLRRLVPWFEDVIAWKRPLTTFIFMSTACLIVYQEWIGKTLAGLFLWVAWKILSSKRGKSSRGCDEVVVPRGADKKSTIESIVSAQYGLITVHKLMQDSNVAIMKILSLLCNTAPKQSDMALVIVTMAAVILLAVPLKYLIVAALLQGFASTSVVGKYITSEQGNRRMKEWWDSIPIVPVKVVDRDHETT